MPQSRRPPSARGSARTGGKLLTDETLQSGALHATIADVKRLLERESELATACAFVRRGGVLVVEGRAGIGKTAILDATCSAGERAGVWFFGRAAPIWKAALHLASPGSS